MGALGPLAQAKHLRLSRGSSLATQALILLRVERVHLDRLRACGIISTFDLIGPLEKTERP